MSSSMYAVANTTGVKRTQPIILSVDALNIMQSGCRLKSHSQTTLINGQEQSLCSMIAKQVSARKGSDKM